MVSQQFDETGNFGILCVEGQYSIAFGHEDVFLDWQGGGLDIGDHYGQATAAVMDVSHGWCATGGEGLLICRFERGFPRTGEPLDNFPFCKLELWRGANPPPDGRRYWRVEGLWFVGSEEADGKLGNVLLHALVSPGTQDAGLYQVDLMTLGWRRILMMTLV